MTEQEREWFKALSKDRSEIADALEKPAARGIKDSVVEKYSDQAHFLYELLQNADDVDATSARFELQKDKLIFAHNGTKRFSISNPATEDADKEKGQLGDINAITSIANSNKISLIGKFGVGFKAVFQYTATPHIYDPKIFFKINRFIVPVKIDDDFPGRKQNETLFIFPFDIEEKKSHEEAFSEIAEKLQSLVYPVLFLKNLEEVLFEYASIHGSYKKSFEDEHELGVRISLIKDDGEKTYCEKLWLFSREYENDLIYDVGFFLNDNGALFPENHTAFCFFPTKEETGLNFIVQAPFLLTDSREGIKAGEQHNKKMIALLAKLAADSLGYLKKIGQEYNKQLIDDNIFDIVPYDENKFNDVNDKNKISFKPFYTAIHEKFTESELLPSSNGYARKENAFWAFVPEIAILFSNEQLANLTNNNNAKWVFSSFGRQEILRKNKALTEYIDSITNNWIDENAIINGKKDVTISNGINTDFIEKQSLSWLYDFYKWISETKGRVDLIKNKSIFLNQDNKAVSAFDEKGQPILFLPLDDPNDFYKNKTINPELLKDKYTENFIKQLGIKKPSPFDEIYNHILPLYDNADDINSDDSVSHFRKFLKYYNECHRDESDNFINLLKDKKIVAYKCNANDKYHLEKANNIYYPTEDLCKYFENKPDAKFLDLEFYRNLIEEGKELLEKFFKELGLNFCPKIIEYIIEYKSEKQMIKKCGLDKYKKNGTSNHCFYLRIIDNHDFFKNLDITKSLLLWRILTNVIEIKHLEMFLHTYNYNGKEKTEYHDNAFYTDNNNKWFLNKNNELVSAQELCIDELSENYDTESECAKKLIDFLGIKAEKAPDDEEAAKKLGFENAGQANQAKWLLECSKKDRRIIKIIEE